MRFVSFSYTFWFSGRLWNKQLKHLWRAGTLNAHTQTRRQNNTRTSCTLTSKQKRKLEEKKQKNSGAQQWLCTRSAYTIFHHYCGEKTLNYWSAPLLPFLSSSLSRSLQFNLLFPCLLIAFYFPLTLLEICKQNKTSEMVPSSKQDHKHANTT